AANAITITTVEALCHHGLDTSGEIALWPHFRHTLPLSLAYLATRTDDPVINALREAAVQVWSKDSPHVAAVG
ncbi:MAG TPA: hypothetical protein VHF69_01815, partial [Candidatus Synoicihabitans sp.]|nr:hypothetical protein [Candidatus Synoicihabitans sp.]